MMYLSLAIVYCATVIAFVVLVFHNHPWWALALLIIAMNVEVHHKSEPR